MFVFNYFKRVFVVGMCECNEGFHGDACELESGVRPTVDEARVCYNMMDGEGYFQIEGEGFQPSEELTCLYYMNMSAPAVSI